MAYTKLGRIRPVHRGTWSASTAYTVLEMVRSGDGRTTYIALKDVPAGIALTNAAYWATVLDASDVIDEAETATANAAAAAGKLENRMQDTSTDLERITDGHLWTINVDADHDVTRYYKTATGEIIAYSAVAGSGFIKCPAHLCLHFSGDDARCWLYFYRQTAGEYVPVWDVYTTEGSADAEGDRVLNYLSSANTASHIIDVPDDVYMQIAVAAGNVSVYGWDGESFGTPLSADMTILTTSGTPSALQSGGSSGVTIPGDAMFVCCKDAALFAIGGYKNGEMTMLDTAAKRKFLALPDGYDFFRARLYFGAGTSADAVTRLDNVSDVLSVAVDSRASLPSARAQRVIEAAAMVCGMRWTPASNVYLYKKSAEDTNGYTFKEGVEYNGIPYGSQWFSAHFVGWHVSPHTFVNAAHDPDSALCREMIRSWPDDANNTRVIAVYGTVCSAFASMCDGWPYPQTNAGFIYDPEIMLSFAANPPLGAVYSNIVDHCLIPERIDRMDTAYAISVYEAANPVSGRRTRYSNIDKTEESVNDHAFYSSHLDGYLDNYGYVAHHMRAGDALEHVPYADFDDVEIVQAGVVPYYGDRCVHTSADGHVYVNIKDTAAHTLILTAPDGSEENIIVSTGTAQIDVKSYLRSDGIYFIRTDTTDTAASFEYRTATPIGYTITDGVISFDRNDWWYAMCVLRGDRYFSQPEQCCVPCRENGDYADWSSGDHWISSAKCVFYKGTYGAYPVQLEKMDSAPAVP